MPHVEVHNATPLAHESLALADEDGVPQFVTLVQATYGIADDGALGLLEEQPPPNLGGEWYGDPANTSLRLEPQMAFMKPSTDVVLLGHAHAAAPGATEVIVGIRVGAVSKLARVVGDRFMAKRSVAVHVSRPRPFDTIPLVYERAFGGWDRRDADSLRHRGELRNPVGVGFRASTSAEDDELALPNIESQDDPFLAYGQVPAPVGFGFIAPHWHPRAQFAGTYDAAWSAERKPLLPTDFDRRFFNAASPGLVTPAHLRGDEPVVVIGANRSGRLAFRLPGIAPPECIVMLRGRNRVPLDARLDTVIVDMDQQRLTLMWRAHVPVRNGPHDVLAVHVHSGPGERVS
jgi:hypothetical protein